MKLLKKIKFGKLSEEELKAKTRDLSVREGGAWSVMYGLGETYLIPFALELKATNFQTGLISGLANLFGPLAQILGSRLMEKYHRKKIVVLAVTLQAASWFGFIALGLLFLRTGPAFYLIPLFIVTYVFYSLFNALSGPAWFSLIGDVVPEKIRGAYFSHRNKISALITAGSTVVAALILHFTQQLNLMLLGFLIMFVLASLHRFLSAYYLTHHYVGELKLKKAYYFSFWNFIKKIPFKNFNRFALYVALINFTACIASPFFAVYMWKDLHFSPLWYTAVTIAPGLVSFFCFPYLGRLADRYGNRELLRIGTLLVIFLPAFWLFSVNPLFLIFVPQVLSGLGWAAFNLAASNFIYDAVGQQRRALCVSYYNLLNGVGIFFGAIIGGLLLKYSNFTVFNSFEFIFVISVAGRLLVALTLLPGVKEVRADHHPASINPLTYLREIQPLSGTFLASVWPLKTYPLINLKKIIFCRRK